MKILFFILFILMSCSQVKTKGGAPSEIRKIASLNYQIKGGKSWQEFADQLDFLLSQSVPLEADYLLLPELITLDLFPINPKDNEIPQSLEKVAMLQTQYEQLLMGLSQKYKQTIIGASSIVKVGGKLLNRAYYISESQLSFQDKIYPTPWETKYGIEKGGKLKTFERGDHRFVILICHDAEFPILSRELTGIKPEIIFVPSQTDDELGLQRVKRTSQARAVEHMSYVAMTGTSGVEKAPWHTYVGRNYLFTPQNKYFTEPQSGSDQAEWTLFEYDIKMLKKARADIKQIYPARDESSWKTAP